MTNWDRLWYAYYKGWFAGRAGRRHPRVHSMVEHAYMVDGYDTGRNSADGVSNRFSKAAPAGNYDAGVSAAEPSTADSKVAEE